MTTPQGRQLLDSEEFVRVVVQQLALDASGGGEAAEDGDGLRTAALGPGAVKIGAVAAVQELVLVTRQEVAGEALVPGQRVEAGTSREIAEHVRVVGEIAVRQAAG